MEWRRRDVSARCSTWGLIVPRARPRRSGGIHYIENTEETALIKRAQYLTLVVGGLL